MIVYVSLAAIGLSFDMLCKKVAYWAMSSRIPRKFPFPGDPTNSLSPLNAKTRAAINLITLTTHFNTGLQYCSWRSTCCVSSVTFRPIAFNLLLKAIVAFNVLLTAYDYVDSELLEFFILLNFSNHLMKDPIVKSCNCLTNNVHCNDTAGTTSPALHRGHLRSYQPECPDNSFQSNSLNLHTGSRATWSTWTKTSAQVEHAFCQQASFSPRVTTSNFSNSNSPLRINT